MATRYVWGKYGIDAVTTASQTYEDGSSSTSGTYYKAIDFDLNDVYWSWNYNWSQNVIVLTNGPIVFTVGTSYSVSNGKFVIGNPTTKSYPNGTTGAQGLGGGNGAQLNVSSRWYTSGPLYIGINNSGQNQFDYLYKLGFTVNQNSYVLLYKFDSSTPEYWFAIEPYSYGSVITNRNSSRIEVGKGSLTGTASNGNSSAYPQNGGSGSSWYVYQGSDSIDATAVGYSNQSPMGGQPITINVTPATPTYGGTIQYTYQVQLSGGSWTTIATKTTATSQQYTIPAGTTSFAARVVANDTWGFSSSTYTTGSTLTVTNNLPPTAPGSISIGSVVGGQQCTITWTAAADPDGTIASYQLERQTDNGDTWTQIYSGSNLTYTDTINADWATVNYRVKATDDDGDSGLYATGTMQTVNDGWLYFSGPPSDMGEQPAPFDFVFSIGSTGATSASSIAVTAIYDDETIYTGTVTSAQQITLPIDTRLTYAGDHDIIVTATASGFLAVTQQCDFTVPSVTLPNGGAAGIMEDDAGKPYYPATLARYVIGLKGLDANALFDRVYTGTYTGTGTSGSGNPCSVRTSFEPTLVFIQAAAASTATSGYWVNSAPGQSSQGNMIVNNNGAVTLCPVTWDAEAMTLSWYGTSAAAQLNASGTVYGIIALGGMA